MSTAGHRQPRIAVVGAGAIGCYYGAKLAAAGGDVHFLMRSDLAAVRARGLEIRERDTRFVLDPAHCYENTNAIGPCDLVLIAVKATSNDSLAELLPPLLGEGTMLLTLQNGLGNEEYLAAHFGAERVLGGLCFVCLNRVAPGIIEHYDHGRLAIGEFEGPSRPRTQEVVAQFHRAGVTSAAVENLGLERWRKLVWNIPFDGLAVAAGGIDTEAILRDARLRKIVIALMEETIDAANRCGFPLAAAEAQAQIERTDSMGAYKPSTLIDFEAGRPLEIEAIWAEPLRRAEAAGADTPHLQFLTALLASVGRAHCAK